MEKKVKLNNVVLWFPLFFMFGMTAFSFANEKAFADAMNTSFAWVAENMAWFFQLVSFSAVALLVTVAISGTGSQIRFGGPEAKPDYGNWVWFSMIVCSGMGVGIVLWGAAEPIYNFAAQPKAAGVEPFTEAAAVWSMSQCFLHWGVTPYALYSIFGLAIGLAHYNYGQPLRTSSGFHFIWGDKRSETFNSLVDMISVISLACGLAVSMGLGVLQVARGLETVAGIAPTKTVWFFITLFITASYTVSSYVGLDRSLKFIARYNMNIFVGSLVFLVIVGPTAFMLNLGVESLGKYLVEFIPKSLWTGPVTHDSYLVWWDIFFWTVWCAYAVIMGVFLARISYGRTIRQFIAANLIGPAIFCCVWFAIYGGTAIKFQLDGTLDLWKVISDRGLEAAVFTFFSELPLGSILSPAFIGLVILSFVTLADPMTSAIASLSCKFEDSGYAGEPPKHLKLVWGIGIGGMALVMIMFAGFDGPRMLSTIVGFPCMLLAMFIMISIIKGVWHPRDAWLGPKVGLFQPSEERFNENRVKPGEGA